ncbi:uncharacterized protein [Chelonus insularis]|nr:uncharacterized protein LOC118064111 isoform X2 [Chelonus insularis]
MIIQIFKVIASLLMGVSCIETVKRHEMILFDFTTANNVNMWSEISDTVREVGASKASLVLQKTRVFQRGVFFTLLNPQPNGACFAGVRMPVEWNLSNYQNIQITCRGQGKNDRYKIVLRHRHQSANNDTEYEQIFVAPTEGFSTVTLPMSEFKAYFRGQPVPDAEPLDTTAITMFGLQVFGGVYESYKQSGVSALEIEKIIATE